MHIDGDGDGDGDSDEDGDDDVDVTGQWGPTWRVWRLRLMQVVLTTFPRYPLQ